MLTVLAVSQLAGLAAVGVWAVASQDELPGLQDLGLAAAAGVAGAVGLGALYRGMAVGAMGIVAPISALAPVVPLVVGLAGGERPTALQFVGIGMALGGVLLVSREPSARRAAARRPAPVWRWSPQPASVSTSSASTEQRMRASRGRSPRLGRHRSRSRSWPRSSSAPG